MNEAVVTEDSCRAEGRERAFRVLSRIAEALGRSPEAFLDEAAAGSSPGATIEMLRLWEALACDADRARVLAFMRDVAAGAAVRDAAG